MIVPGARLDKYEVLEKVGEGGMATVYRGRHLTLNREVAIKVMHPHLASSEKNRTRFEREARAIETLRHPNILRIFDYSGNAADQCFIITEFIEGPTLRELLDDVGAMMPEPAAMVTYELCKALEAAHDRGIVHRDIKPENVMLTASGGVKLMDFGIARMLDDAQVTMTGALVGSPAYMSPEQATDGQVGHPSDLFAVGIMLYRMVTGTLPFRGSNPSIVIKAIIDGIYEDPGNRVPSLSPELADIIRRCLNGDLSVRYSTASELRADLRACLVDVGIDPDQPGGWSVSSFLEDPEGYEENLREHLLLKLVARGRREAEAGRTAGALRAFNRVLALDEDNEEVVSIIEGMRTPLEGGDGRRGTALWLAAAVLVASVAGGLLWQLTRTPGGEVAGLEAAVLIPAIPVPIPDTEPAPPEPTPPEEPPSPEPRDAAGVALAKSRAAAARSVGGAVPDPTPAEVEPTPEEATPAPTCEGPGVLEVRVADGWTYVVLDGKRYQDEADAAETIITKGKVKQIELPAGTYNVTLKDKGYHVPSHHTVEVCGNRPPAVVVGGTQLSPHKVTFDGFPPDATVYVNDEERGPPAQEIALPSGAGYTVRVMHGERLLADRTLIVSTEPDSKAFPGGTTTLQPGT